MSFTFHYCKKIPGTQEGPLGDAFPNSSPALEMRLPVSLVCQDGETVNVKQPCSLDRRDPQHVGPDQDFKFFTQGDNSLMRMGLQRVLITQEDGNRLFYSLSSCRSGSQTSGMCVYRGNLESSSQGFLSIVWKNHSVNFLSWAAAVWLSSCSRMLSCLRCCTSSCNIALSSFSCTQWNTHAIKMGTRSKKKTKQKLQRGW